MCRHPLEEAANDQTKRLAAEALKPTSKDLFRLKVIDHIIAEPLGGAHRDPVAMGNRLREYLERYLRDLVEQSVEALLDGRYAEVPRDGRLRRGPRRAGAGCQMNVLDSELVVGALRRQGYSLTHEATDADLILFNTCSVRQHAEDKIYSAASGRVRPHQGGPSPTRSSACSAAWRRRIRS